MFDEKYFNDIWGTVHRHDYCEGVANSLIAKYGKVRFLDIGTGCGYLVKLLNDLGAVAYGLEISKYAVENSHGNVIEGSVTDIPFRDDSFDAVYSQGLWEYVPEADIQKAWIECDRVGKNQEHNIDCWGSGVGEGGFVTARSRGWWDQKLKLPKILVACPNHEVKEYSFQRWIDSVKNLSYPNYNIVVSDNSPTINFLEKWENQIPMLRIDVSGMEKLSVKRTNYSYEQIRQVFLNGDYDRLMILESDIIAPPDVIQQMIKWGKDSDWISHAYPARDGGDPDEQKIQGIGCSLFSRRLMEKYDFMS